MVDVYTGKDPAFGKFWLGLHLALVYDAIQRLPFRNPDKVDLPGTLAAPPQVVNDDEEDFCGWEDKPKSTTQQTKQGMPTVTLDPEVDSTLR